MRKIWVMLGFTFLVGLIAYWALSEDSLRFVQRATHVMLPDGCTEKKYWDTGNGFVGGTLILPQDKISDFLTTNYFRPLTEMPTLTDYLNDTTGKMMCPEQLLVLHVFENRAGYAPIENEESLMYVRGLRTDKWPWEFVVNPATGQLWFVFVYPDFGGD